MTASNQLLFEIGKQQSEMFVSNNVAYISTLVNCKSPKSLMKWVYGVLIGEKLIPPISELPKDKRESIWADTLDFIKQFGREPLSKEEKIAIAKSLYAIEYYLK